MRQKSPPKKIILSGLIILFLFSFASSVFAADWYNTNWAYRKPITILSTMTPSDQTDFPVLITITDPANPVFANALWCYLRQ